jgi:hypothetical protein
LFIVFIGVPWVCFLIFASLEFLDLTTMEDLTRCSLLETVQDPLPSWQLVREMLNMLALERTPK